MPSSPIIMKHQRMLLLHTRKTRKLFAKTLILKESLGPEIKVVPEDNPVQGVIQIPEVDTKAATTMVALTVTHHSTEDDHSREIKTHDHNHSPEHQLASDVANSTAQTPVGQKISNATTVIRLAILHQYAASQKETNHSIKSVPHPIQ